MGGEYAGPGVRHPRASGGDRGAGRRADPPCPCVRQARPRLPRPAGRRGHQTGRRVSPISAKWRMFYRRADGTV